MAEIITGKRVAEIYFSLQRHFENGSYDICTYKYNPIKLDLHKYVSKYPVKYCQILGEKVKNEKGLFDICIPSFVEKDWYLIQFMEDYDNRRMVSIKWQDRLNAVSYNFSQACYEIRNRKINLDANFGNVIVELYMNDEITLESFCIFIDLFSLTFENNFIWSKTSLGDRVLAYKKMIKFDLTQYRTIFVEIMRGDK